MRCVSPGPCGANAWRDTADCTRLSHSRYFSGWILNTTEYILGEQHILRQHRIAHSERVRQQGGGYPFFSSSLSMLASSAITCARTCSFSFKGNVSLRDIGARSIGYLPSRSLIASSACFFAGLLVASDAMSAQEKT